MRRASVGSLTHDEILNLKKDDSRGLMPVMSSNHGRSTPSSSFRTISSVNDLMAASADLLSDQTSSGHEPKESRTKSTTKKLDMADKRLEEERIQAAHACSMELRRIELEEHAHSMELQRIKLDEQRMPDEKAQWAFLMNNQEKE